MEYLTELEVTKIASDCLGFEVFSKGKTKGGVSSFVYELESGDGRKYYFKQGNSNYVLQRELTEKLTESGLMLPKIELATERYMLVKGVVGEPMREIVDRERRLTIAEAFGNYLALIHAQSVFGWGELVGLYKAKHQSYLDFYDYLLPEVDKDILPIVTKVLRETKLSCLNHADTGDVHIYIDREEKFWGLIDFDDVIGAPNLYDLAEFHGGLDGDEEMWKRFMVGYTNTGAFADAGNVEFLVNEYLVFLDSAVWYAKSGNPELEENRQRDLFRIESLVNRIKELQ